MSGRERAALLRPRVLRDAVEVTWSVSRPCASGENAMQPTPSSPSTSSRSVLDPAVEHRVRGLVDEQRRAELAQDRGRLAASSPPSRTRCRRRAPCPAAPRVSSAPIVSSSGVLGVEAVRVEDVDVVEAQAPQALVEAREQVLARAPVAVRPGPHVVAGLGGDDQLVAVRARSPSRRMRPKFSSAVPYGGP